MVLVGREHLERIAQLLERCRQQLDVAAVGVVAHQLVRGFLDLFDPQVQIFVQLAVGLELQAVDTVKRMSIVLLVHEIAREHRRTSVHDAS